MAAVLLADDEGRPCFLLTKRTPKLRAHGGQWALPGGRLDAGETVEAAALRELQEEVGLTCGPASILGLLDDYGTRSGFIITPVVVWGGGDVALKPNPDEVASIHRVPLTELDKPDLPRLISIPESDRPVIQLPLLGTLIHAPTAAVVYQLARGCRPRPRDARRSLRTTGLGLALNRVGWLGAGVRAVVAGRARRIRSRKSRSLLAAEGSARTHPRPQPERPPRAIRR